MPRIILPVILLGFFCWLFVDSYVESVARGIHFGGAWGQLDGLFQDMIRRRGARAVWLWTMLPASIGWMMAGNAVKRIEKLLN